MARATNRIVSLFSFRFQQQRWAVLFLGFLLLLLAHGTALFFRIQPAVSLWFPPSGVAIALTLWLGPIGALLTWVASFVVAPIWGVEGWARFASITDAIEPLVAWFLFHRGFQAAVSLKSLRDAAAFLISAPLAACGTSALLGTLVLVAFGKMSFASLAETIPSWWLGNAIGTLVIVPVVLLFISCLRPRDGTHTPEPIEPRAQAPQIVLRHRWVEIGLVLASVVLFALLTVKATQVSIFVTLQFSLLSLIPVLWTVARFGVTGSVMTASFSVVMTLLAYLLLYPNAISLPTFPVSPELLFTHKLSLLLQSAIALLAGTAITERSTAQVALEVEQIKRAEYETRAHLSEELLQLNRLLTETNQQLQVSEERFRTSIENMLDCFGVYTAIRNEQGQIVDFCIEYVNDAACVSNQLSRAEQIGRRLCEILPEHLTSGLFSAYCQVVETGQPLIKDSLIYADKDGQRRLVRALDIRIAKLEDGFVCTWRDVTDRRLMEEELHRHKQELETLVENSPDIIARIDRELRHVYINPAIETITGIPVKNFIGKTNPELGMPADLCHKWATTFQSVFATGQKQVSQFSFLSPDEALHYYESLLVPEVAQDGYIESIICITRDITQLKQVELSLRQANEQFHLASEAVNSAIYDWDTEQNRIERTSGMDRVLGYTAAEIEPTSEWYLVLIHPDDLQRVTQAIRAAFTSGDRYNLEYRIRNRQGDYVYVADQGLVIRDQAGQVIRVVGSVANISDRKQVEIALNDANERFQLAMAAINGMVYDYDIRHDHVERTEGFTHILGYCPNEVPTTAAWWHEQIHPDDYQHIPQHVEEAPTTDDRYNFEYRVRHKQGHYVHVMDQCMILRNEAGYPVRMVGSTTDITARKQAEASLRHSEARLRRLVDSNIIGIIEATLKQITVANDAFLNLVGYDRDEVLSGRVSWQDFTPAEYLERDYQGVDELLASGVCTPFEKEYIRKDGSRVPILIGAALVEREPLTWICFILDLSERKQLESERAELLKREQAARQQAESASQMKDEFLAIVSHELRSPLNGILGWSRLLRTRTLDPNTTEKALASIERNAQAQTQLIEDLLDISRIIRGNVRLSLRPVNLIPVIQASLDTVRPTTEVKSIQLLSQLQPNIGLVAGDAERLQQIIWNLLSNAVKFTPEGGRVEVQLARMGSHAQIQVIDTGKGINAEFLPHVFDRFRQADGTTTRTQGGLGLGLAIVRNLVELHGGTIWAESAGEGRGATFIVELPLLPNSPQQTNADFVASLPGDPGSLAGVSVLVVDDEADTREFLTIALEQFGATVTAAASVSEAFLLFQQNPPDILLSDIGMPEEDGYALIRKIRALPSEAGGQTPAAALTAYVRGDDRREALKSGFQMHVPKPIEPMQLLKVVSQLAWNTGKTPGMQIPEKGTSENPG